MVISVATVVFLTLGVCVTRNSLGQCPDMVPGSPISVIWFNFCSTLGVCSVMVYSPAQQFCIGGNGSYCFTQNVAGQAMSFSGSCQGDGSCIQGDIYTTTYPTITVISDSGPCYGSS